jgi:formylglycine-generating enzyme required for sulfatase activity
MGVRNPRGLTQQVFPWGDELPPNGEHLMNVWQGKFPGANTVADGYFGTCPVDAFPMNGFGLYNTTGKRLGVDGRLVPSDVPAARPPA